MSLTEGVAGLVLPGADVQPGQENSVVVSFPAFPHQAGLPLTEAVEGLVGVMVDGQTQLEKRRDE